MNDLISRQAAIEAFADMREGYPVVYGDMLSDADVIAILQDLPSCTTCDFCPNCGAKMN